jgi:hypothetical protein
VQRLLEHSKAAPEHRPLYGQKVTAKPGLWLVGDQGVYLMSNGKPWLTDQPLSPTCPRCGAIYKPGDTVCGSCQDPRKITQVICYADECNPEILPFDEWWANKQVGFGGDDGCEYLDAASLEKALAGHDDKLLMDITPKQIALLGPRQVKKLDEAQPKKGVRKRR